MFIYVAFLQKWALILFTTIAFLNFIMETLKNIPKYMNIMKTIMNPHYSPPDSNRYQHMVRFVLSSFSPHNLIDNIEANFRYIILSINIITFNIPQYCYIHKSINNSLILSHIQAVFTFPSFFFFFSYMVCSNQ